MISHKIEVRVRFNEADPLGIVWHGHYLRYFEDGREAFGAIYKLGYLDMFDYGYIAPIVKIGCDYKRSLQYGQVAIVETTIIDNPAAKMIFNYKIFLPESDQVVAHGSSIQVFLDKETKQLQLSNPEFFEQWKRTYFK